MALLLGLSSAVVAADHPSMQDAIENGGSPPVAMPQGNANPQGAPYGIWGARWWQWILSLQVHDAQGNVSHPLLTAGAVDCSIGQSGNVWFLAGTITPGATQRSCTLPGGVWLFFPVINAWGDNTGLTEPLTQTVPEMKEAVAFLSEPVASSLHVIVDGVAASVTADNRGAAVFQYELPNTDNLLQYFGAQVPGPGWPYGNTPLKTIVAPALSDGYWMMLKPLSAGSHTINFGATAANTGFSLDITYNVTVK